MKAKEKVQKISQISREKTFPGVFRVKNWNNLPGTNSVGDGLSRSQPALREMTDVKELSIINNTLINSRTKWTRQNQACESLCFL